MAEPRDPGTGAGTSGLATDDGWRLALADALRANGFEVTPPAIDDDEPLTVESLDVPAAGPSQELDPAPPSGWWAEPDEPGMDIAQEPIPPVSVILDDVVVSVDDDQLVAADDADALAPVADATPIERGVTGEIPHHAQVPPTLAEPRGPTPPSFLASRLGRGTVAAAAASPVEPMAPVQVEPPAVAPAAQVEPEAPAEPVADPREAIAWPDPQPIDEERWRTDASLASAAPSADALVASTDLRSPVAEVPGFAFGDIHEPTGSSPAPIQDPWAGVTFSATPSAEAVAASQAMDPSDGDSDADDLGSLRAEATAWLEADAAERTGDAQAVEDAIAQPTPAPWEAPPPAEAAADITDASGPWTPQPPALTDEPVADPAVAWPAADARPPLAEPALDAAPEGSAPADPEPPSAPPPAGAAPFAPPVLTQDPGVDLDPGRVEFIGYADVAAGARPATPPEAATPPAAATAAPGAPDAPAAPDAPWPLPPTGSILDIGRRPPGARPVDPATLSTSTSTGAPAAGTPGATGADLWDLVTAPSATAAPATPSPRSSRAATLLLTILVALVIVALVAGFLYSFTELL